LETRVLGDARALWLVDPYPLTRTPENGSHTYNLARTNPVAHALPEWLYIKFPRGLKYLMRSPAPYTCKGGPAFSPAYIR